MAKERARRRAEREALAAREKAKAARQRRRRDALRRLKPSLPRRRRRTGSLLARRSRAERAGIVALPAVLVAATWFLVDPLGLRLVLIVLLVLVLPAVVVIALGRRT